MDMASTSFTCRGVMISSPTPIINLPPWTPFCSSKSVQFKLQSVVAAQLYGFSSKFCDAGYPVAERRGRGIRGIFEKRRLEARRRGQIIVGASASIGTGSAAMLAKEMERIAAKEALLLCIKDAGGLKGLPDPVANDSARVDVNEKVLALERLNPTPRPTTSQNLEGLWQFEWAAARSPANLLAATVLGRIPPALASINSLTLLIAGESTKATGTFKIFNAIDSNFSLITRINIEGPARLKEEYVEGLFATPKIPEGTLPQLRGVFNQFEAAITRLPDNVMQVVNGGLKIPLTGMFSRELIISYLDEELMVARDKSGVPDVLLRINAPATDLAINFDAPD